MSEDWVGRKIFNTDYMRFPTTTNAWWNVEFERKYYCFFLLEYYQYLYKESEYIVKEPHFKQT